MFRYAQGCGSSHALRCGRKAAGSRVTIILPEQPVEAKVDGVLPTDLRHSLFISHSGYFVVLTRQTVLNISQS